MNTPPDPENAPPLDYAKPAKSSSRLDSPGCLAIAILLAAVTFSPIIFFMLDAFRSYEFAPAALFFGILIAAILAVVITKKLGGSAALAMVIASLCVILLLLGLCSSWASGL